MSQDSLGHKKARQQRRSNRVRTVVRGTSDKPRLSVHISHRHVSAQIINDETGKTLAYTTTVGTDLKGNLSEKATWTGESIANKASKAKVKSVVFDRGARQYHGRVKQLAEAARKGGLDF